MTKILFVSDTRLPTEENTPQHGLGHCVLSYAKEMAKRNYEVDLLAGEGSDGQQFQKVFHAKDERDYVRDYEVAFYKNYDVVIDFSHKKLIGSIYETIPVIDFSVDRESRPSRNPVFNSYAHRNYWRMKGEVVPSGVDTKLYSYNGNPHNQYVLYLAPMYPQKGFKTALFAAKETGFNFIIAGPGTEMIRGGVGPVVGKEKIKLLKNAAALLFPSPHEAGPRTVLEAMSCGTPVMCYDYGGAAEYVKHGVGGLAAKHQIEYIQSIKDVVLLDRYTCRKHVQENYSEKVVGNKLEEVIKMVLKGVTWNGYNRL